MPFYRKSKTQPVSQVIHNFLDQHKLQGKMHELRVKDIWMKTMGAMIANRTVSLKVSDKKLFILVSSAPLREELFIFRDKIKTTLNKEIGDEFIEEVIVK